MHSKIHNNYSSENVHPHEDNISFETLSFFIDGQTAESQFWQSLAFSHFDLVRSVDLGELFEFCMD